jgi:hypothetical protein
MSGGAIGPRRPMTTSMSLGLGAGRIQATLSDAPTYTGPWTVAVKAELAADTELIEFVCNENNRSLEHWVGKASDERKGEVQVAPEILAKYVGTYEEQPPLWRAVVRRTGAGRTRKWCLPVRKRDFARPFARWDPSFDR